MQAGEFEFLLRQGDQEVARATNDANGNFVFDSITFDTAGTYHYTVSEVDGGLGGVSYDSTIYTVRVDVTENVDANALEAKVTYIDNADMATELDAMTLPTPTSPPPLSLRSASLRSSRTARWLTGGSPSS